MKQDYYLWLWYRIGGVDYRRRFNAIWQKPTPVREGPEYTGKRAGIYTIVTGVRVEYAIEISSDELFDEDAKKFAANWYLANEQYISFAVGDPDPLVTPPDTEYIAVTTGSGPLPETLIEDNQNFSELSFLVRETKGRTWNATTEEYDPVYHD